MLISDSSTVRATKQGGLIDRSGVTHASVGTSTSLMDANQERRYLLVQNVGADPIWINFGAPATTGAGSVKLVPNDALVLEDTFVSIQEITVASAASSVPYTAKEG